ncbi:hypothetical protein K491DRAFT_719531 [Lophiostoma macrostomum CBS 122681]|uniref:AA1-like domain-containing protein n=1 Tax=Lophiostoma macrostomum CBS 122681 TaxID=1314788 RepID=A0A6A6SYY6_9PLEO|nr:hypothetical protein K491DRAFT_719531 [Lophiostoma macrostomum CBS 122681]
MRSFFSTLLFAVAAVADVTIHLSGPEGEWAVDVPATEFDQQIDLSNTTDTQHKITHLHLTTDDDKTPGCYISWDRQSEPGGDVFIFVDTFAPGQGDGEWPGIPVASAYCTFYWE